MPREENSPEIFKEIDESLRKAYEELLNEELPDRFQQLLQKLRDDSPDLEPSCHGDGGVR